MSVSSLIKRFVLSGDLLGNTGHRPIKFEHDNISLALFVVDGNHGRECLGFPDTYLEPVSSPLYLLCNLCIERTIPHGLGGGPSDVKPQFAAGTDLLDDPTQKLWGHVPRLPKVLGIGLFLDSPSILDTALPEPLGTFSTAARETVGKQEIQWVWEDGGWVSSPGIGEPLEHHKTTNHEPTPYVGILAFVWKAD